MKNSTDVNLAETLDCFRIADLAGSSSDRGPTVFRFVNSQTIASTDQPHSALVDAANAYLHGEDNAFKSHKIRFTGAPLSDGQLVGFARELAGSIKTSHRPIFGRYWKGFEIADIGTFDGISFWLSYEDLERSPWARDTAIEILNLSNPVYVETIDHCAPEIFRVRPADSLLQSQIDPSLGTAEIVDLLIKTVAPAPALSRKEWEIVSEFRGSAFEVAKAEATAQGQSIETLWRWQPEFNRKVVSHRAAWVNRSQY